MDDTLSWQDFLRDINEIKFRSDQLHDDWNIIVHSEDEGHTYLVKKIKQNVNWKNGNPSENNESTDDIGSTVEYNTKILLQFEYHILFHISYRVPFLCFNAYKSNGTLLRLEDAWQIFDKHFLNDQNGVNMCSILTEMDHPILFKPFLSLHPCRTAELLSALPQSKNKVLSFVSAIGPAVHLNLSLDFGMYS